MKLDLVGVEYKEQEWESVSLYKYQYWDGFIFNNIDLKLICGGPFSSSDVEIIEVFHRAMRFSLIRREDNQLLFFSVLFSEKTFVELFFGDVRWPKRQVIIISFFTISGIKSMQNRNYT